MQLAGPDALATDDVMEVLRSVLAQVLPVTYNDVDPQAYKNVTICPATAPGAAPIPSKQAPGKPSALAPPSAPGQPGNPGQNTGRRRLQVRSVLVALYVPWLPDTHVQSFLHKSGVEHRDGRS